MATIQSTWTTITFTDGIYSYSDINDYIHQYMDQTGHYLSDGPSRFRTLKKHAISLSFILSTYRVLITLGGGYKLDLRGTEFGDLMGFEKKLLTKTEYGTRLPNITKSIDPLNINVDAVQI